MCVYDYCFNQYALLLKCINCGIDKMKLKCAIDYEHVSSCKSVDACKYVLME